MSKLASLVVAIIMGATLPTAAQINLGNMVDAGDIAIPSIKSTISQERAKAFQLNLVHFKSLVREKVGDDGVYRNVKKEDITAFFKGVEKYALPGKYLLELREDGESYIVSNGRPAVDAARAMRRKAHANILLSICPLELAKTAPKIELEFHKTLTTPAEGGFEIVTSVLEDEIANTFYLYKLGLVSITKNGKDRVYTVVPLEVNPDVKAIADKLTTQATRSYVKSAKVL